MNNFKLCSLKNQYSYNNVSNSGAKYSSAYFLIICSFRQLPLKSTKKGLERDVTPIFYGFKVSKKYGKAHERNLLKRRVKNISLELAREMSLRNFSYIFIPRSKTIELDFTNLKNELKKATTWLKQRLEKENV